MAKLLKWLPEDVLSLAGPDHLALLQFFLNHRRFVRTERRGNSLAGLLSRCPIPTR